MISKQFVYSYTNIPFGLWQFENFFEPTILSKLIEESNGFEYKQSDGDRTNTPGPRIFCNTQKHTLRKMSQWFAQDQTKKLFSEIMQHDFTQLRTRVELCLDSPGTWLKPHTDDIAKKFVFQIYLNDGGRSTKLGDAQVVSKINSGWMFTNTGTELHELPPLMSKRTSIIVNYVDETWRDGSVLEEG